MARVLIATTIACVSTAAALAVQCVGFNGKYAILCEGDRTGSFELIGISFPGKSLGERKRLATYCGATDEAFDAFIPTIPDALDQYKGRTVNVKGKRGRAVWLVDENDTCINADIVRRGLVLAPRRGQRTHVDTLNEAEEDAMRSGAGMWGLEPRTDPALDLRFDYHARTEKETVEDETRRYSGNRVRFNDKTTKHIRTIELKVDASAAKRPVEMVIKYQFKKATYDGDYADNNNRELEFTPVQSLHETILPGEIRTVTIKSPSVESDQHFSTSGSRYSFKRGEEYVGDVVVVTCGKRELFSRGALKHVAASD